MATAPTITYLLLDADIDPVFTPQAQLVDGQAVRQAIYTRLELFFGEWWADLNLGLPVFQSMLGKLGSKRTQAAISLAIQQQIESVPYVTSITNIQVSFQDGNFAWSANVQTAFGAITVANVPGQSASLDV